MIGIRTVKFDEVNYMYIPTHCTYKLILLN